MTEAGGCPVVHFDHNSDEHSADPVGSYRALREKAPVAWSEAHGGYWVLSSYQAVFEAARHDEIFSSSATATAVRACPSSSRTPMHFHIPIEIDPPNFRKWRKLINPITAPAAVDRMKGMVEHYVSYFIDQVIESGEADMSSVIGVPSLVTVDWLGLDVKDWRRYASAHHAALAAVPGSEQYQHAVEVDFPYINEKTWEVIRARREHPQDDIVSYLVQQEVDDRPVTDDEVFSIVDLLLAGGVGTTASLVSNTVVWLYQKNPDVRQQLIDDPSLLDKAIEEFLRYFSPTQALARTVVEDTEFLGCPMKTGDRVLLAWNSANRDAQQFDDPDQLDITRWPNRHTAFGIGVHRCAGSNLGRVMAKELLGQILERMPDYVVDVDSLEPYPHQGTNTGYQSIPATFTPGPRRLTGVNAPAVAY